MVTKVFVSQIDKTKADGTTAADGSIALLVNGNTVWYDGGPIAGPIGFRGSIGYEGSAANLGYIGSQGALGFIGSIGITGFRGSAGFTLTEGEGGFTGSHGAVGALGARGNTGFRGSVGEVGYIGSTNTYAPRGQTGFAGSLGVIGFKGSKGTLGYIGSQGDFISGGFNFNQLTDFSPNTYVARYLPIVNEDESGLTQVSNTKYVTGGFVSANLNFSNPNYPDTRYINYPGIKSYSEAFASISSSDFSGGNIVLDFSKGKIFNILLDTATSSVNGPPTFDLEFRGQAFTVTLYLKQDSTGGRLMNWWTNMYWPVGEGILATGPILSTEPNVTDVITMTTFDGMASWYCVMVGKTFY